MHTLHVPQRGRLARSVEGEPQSARAEPERMRSCARGLTCLSAARRSCRTTTTTIVSRR